LSRDASTKKNAEPEGPAQFRQQQMPTITFQRGTAACSNAAFREEGAAACSAADTDNYANECASRQGRAEHVSHATLAQRDEVRYAHARSADC
jgi:hypothetical protein